MGLEPTTSRVSGERRHRLARQGWSSRGMSKPRPPACRAGALPLSYATVVVPTRFERVSPGLQPSATPSQLRDRGAAPGCRSRRIGGISSNWSPGHRAAWSRQQDSNPSPPLYKCGALPMMSYAGMARTEGFEPPDAPDSKSGGFTSLPTSERGVDDRTRTGSSGLEGARATGNTSSTWCGRRDSNSRPPRWQRGALAN